MQTSEHDKHDIHSFSQPEQIRVRHIDLDLDVQFERKMLAGTATLQFERVSTNALVLDTRDLKINKAETASDDNTFVPAQFEVGKSDPILGAPLTIRLPQGATRVRIHYSTAPTASALQWLEPPQTAGKKYPFLYTQSEAIHARSWIPLQDTPGVRVTYSAHIRTPKPLLAVMSAEMDQDPARTGEYRFRMPQPVPSYLIALAVGDLAFQTLSQRTGVYAEPPVIERAAREFSDTEKMIESVEQLYGPYRWGRYDILVLPPSFPFGGMENPRLTFATPTILAGDKSLVSLVAHELAHSWSGNLVTNATWSDFWLNEGFTVYLERRILEKVYGRVREEMEASLGLQDLKTEMSTLEERDRILHVDLKGRDPDAGFTQVPYEKGALFLRSLEEATGRDQFDVFLREYFDHFKFQSITTAEFVAYLRQNLPKIKPDLIEDWIYKPAMPANAAIPKANVFAGVRQTSDSFWSTQEWLYFLRSFPEPLGAEKMRELDRAHRLTQSENAEILNQWLLMAIRNHYKPAYPRLEEFLLSVGRRKYLKPLYEELVKTPEGRKRARAIYEKARPAYHPIAQATLDAIVKP